MESDTRKRPKRTSRSKSGCLNCKKLKIKCSENKLNCEYCLQTKRQCIYPKELPIKLIKKRAPPKRAVLNDEFIDGEALANKSVQKLNSMSTQLGVSKFELLLLKFYLQFGAEFFTFNVHRNLHYFWEVEVPRLWCSSDLVKRSLYAVSASRLLANYDQDSVQNVYFDNDNPGSITTSRINIYDEATKFMNDIQDLMEFTKMMISTSTNDQTTVDLVGQCLVAKKAMIGCKVILPRLPTKEQPKKITSFILYDLMISTKTSFQPIIPYLPLLQNTKYENFFDPRDMDVSESADYDLVYISHLRQYTTSHFDSLDISQLTYLDAISKFEAGVKKTIKYKYPTALFMPLLEIANDSDFMDLLQQKDHLSLKIMFYIGCVNGVFHYQGFGKSGAFEEVIYFYKDYCADRFPNGWEDEIDKNMYEGLMKRLKMDVPYDLNAIKNVGKPMNEFCNKNVELIGELFPPVFFT